MSPIVILTAVESVFGFLVTSLILFLVLRHRRETYSYPFAAFLFICMIWDLGIFSAMLRNNYVEELDIIGRIAVLPCVFLPALIFHFVNLYIGKPIKWAVILVWVMTGLTWIPIIMGVFYRIEGYYTYTWGNIFRVVGTIFDPIIFILWFGINLSACWLLFTASRNTKVPLRRRHFRYVFVGFLAVTFAIVKTLVTQGIDISYLLPLGMFLNDAFAAIMGVAIIKDRLFDITVIIKRGTLYSILAALLIFIYSFMEHILVTAVGEKIGENSTTLHLVSIAIGIAVLMPVKSRLEKSIEKYFAHRKLEF